jgi:surface antigen
VSSCRTSSTPATRLASTLALVVVVGVCAGAGRAAPSRLTRPAGVIVHGYPFAGRCPEAGEEEVVDRWGMYACNCTSYVAWALHANHQRTDWFIPGSMDAWNWPNVARRRGLRVTSRARVGAVAAWPKLARPFGHVAYVTRLHRDGTFDVAEYNRPGDRSLHFRFDTRTHLAPAGAAFIDVPERADG